MAHGNTRGYFNDFGALADITFDATGNNAGAGTSLTIASFAVGSGSNRILLVAIQAASNVANITGVTFNSVSMTLLDSYVPATGNWSSGSGLVIYYLLNPDNTTANIVISASSSITMMAVAVSYSGVAQSSTFGTVSKVRKGATSPIDFSITTGQNKSAIIMQIGSNNSTVPTISYTSPQTKRGESTTGGQKTDLGEAVYAVAGAQTPQATWSGGTNIDVAGMAVEMKAA